MVRVVYICGLGRSGSTFLDVLLGQHADIQSLGECGLHLRSGWGQDCTCSCGLRSRECPFWKEVLSEWVRLSGEGVVAEYTALESAYGRLRRLPAVLAQRLRPTPSFRTFCEQTASLYQAIATVSGKTVLVDSSKTPTRAIALSMVPEVDLRLLHLVRDPRGMVWSHRRRASNQVDENQERVRAPSSVRLSLSWVLGNVQADWLSKRLGPRRFVRITYEEVMASPETAMAKLGSMIECDLSEVTRSLSEGQTLQVGHLAGGNRLRMANSIRPKPDFEWKDKLPARDHRIILSLAGRLMRKYQYNV